MTKTTATEKSLALDKRIQRRPQAKPVGVVGGSKPHGRASTEGVGNERRRPHARGGDTSDTDRSTPPRTCARRPRRSDRPANTPPGRPRATAALPAIRSAGPSTSPCAVTPDDATSEGTVAASQKTRDKREFRSFRLRIIEVLQGSTANRDPRFVASGTEGNRRCRRKR